MLEHWAPPLAVTHDRLGEAPAAALAAALGTPQRLRPTAGGTLPPLWHWLYFLSWPEAADTGPDGHPGRGGFAPPLPGHRRMWAGGRLEVRRPLVVGAVASRRSAVAETSVKAGRSGPLTFVTLRREIEQDGEVCVVEDQTLVYRAPDGARTARPPATSPPSTGPSTSDAAWSAPLPADAVLLFRFSALTANSHRIHYDRPYAVDVEGYPGVVVHGPLLALCMAELLRAYEERPVLSLRYRLHQPAFLGDELVVEGGPTGDGVSLRVRSGVTGPHATAEVVLAPPRR